jgi:uncharacterized protein YhhL (DUF1145 family)
LRFQFPHLSFWLSFSTPSPSAWSGLLSLSKIKIMFNITVSFISLLSQLTLINFKSHISDKSFLTSWADKFHTFPFRFFSFMATFLFVGGVMVLSFRVSFCPPNSFTHCPHQEPNYKHHGVYHSLLLVEKVGVKNNNGEYH